MNDTRATAAPPPEGQASAASSQRLMSLDALRGFDMFWIIGADSLVRGLRSVSDTGFTGALARQLEHAHWEGFRFYDLIFPLFVFIVGVALVYSLTRTIAQAGRAQALRRVFVRSALLFALGLFYSGGFTNPWPDIRLLGVLNRIALAYCFAGLLFCCFKPRVLAGICAGLLAGYWALLTFVPFPDVRPTPETTIIAKETGFTNVAQLNLDSARRIRGSYLKGVNLANYLDQKYLPGRKYDGTWDPEGLLSTLPAVATCLLGVFAGLWLRNAGVGDKRKVLGLLVAGLVAAGAGWLWSLQFPVIKKIWTSSYVLVAGGYSALLLGAFYFIVDVCQLRAWCQPFVWMGMNSITVYVTSNLLGGFRRIAPRLVGGDIKAFLDERVTPGFGDLTISLVGLLLAFWFVRFLYRRKIFLRL
jgi:predicted acyltransferase